MQIYLKINICNSEQIADLGWLAETIKDEVVRAGKDSWAPDRGNLLRRAPGLLYAKGMK